MKRRLARSWSALVLALSVGSLACSGAAEGAKPAPGTGATATGGSGNSAGSSTAGERSASAGNAATAGTGSPPDLHSPTFACAPDAAPASLPLRRLSSIQLKNTIKDLIGFALPKSATAVLSEVGADVEQLPVDSRQGPDTIFARFDRLDQTVQQRLVDDEYALAREIGAALTSSAERLRELVGACATQSSDQACLDGFIQRFGERVQRRTLAPEDLAFYRRAAGVAPYTASGYADVVGVLLASPYLLYAVEHGQSATDTRTKLSAFELAARLSYQFWQTAPDTALLDAARSGELSTDDGFKAQLERVLGDAKAERGISEFIGQWLENPKLEDLAVRAMEPAYRAFLAGFEPSSELKSRMQREIVDASLYYVQSGGSFADFFGSNRSFAKTADLAKLYGAPIWAGTEPPVFSGRAGLLTRAALLATGLSDTRPIIKGVLIRKAILCDDVPPPPAEVANSPPPLSDAMVSTREAVQGKTSSGSCAGCHTQLINDLGFATENFDALGRLRAEQPLFDAQGKQVGSASVDTSSVPKVEARDPTASSGVADLTRLILASEKPYACFARQYFRFTFSRLEQPAQDGCALAALKDKLQANAGLSEVLKAIALDRSFQERSF
ncbi:MAG TPA: DUF1592 domain-containing protein [Polyangiaceae bacterium]|nr:DUF1592 domain-containing protein [Polyangiaceae bacterium]